MISRPNPEVAAFKTLESPEGRAITSACMKLLDEAVTLGINVDPVRIAQYEKTAQLLASQPLIFNRTRFDNYIHANIKLGHVVTEQGPLRFVLRDPAIDAGVREWYKDRLIHCIHAPSTFTHIMPPTVYRQDVQAFVQERVGGRTLVSLIQKIDQQNGNDVAGDINISPTLARWLLSPGFCAQLESAYLEIGILGDYGQLEDGNMGFVSQNRKFQIANFDLEDAFDPHLEFENSVPYAPDLEAFEGRPISEKGQKIVTDFLRLYDRANGRAYLELLGLDQRNIDAVFRRAEFYRREKHFPC